LQSREKHLSPRFSVLHHKTKSQDLLHHLDEVSAETNNPGNICNPLNTVNSLLFCHFTYTLQSSAFVRHAPVTTRIELSQSVVGQVLRPRTLSRESIWLKLVESAQPVDQAANTLEGPLSAGHPLRERTHPRTGHTNWSPYLFLFCASTHV
jgi:hypothetical protein